MKKKELLLELLPLARMDPLDLKDLVRTVFGFHNNKTTEIKPAFSESQTIINLITKPIAVPVARKENQIYQNELSVFYGRENSVNVPVEITRVEKMIRNATKSQRVLAYVLDVSLVLSFVAIVLTVMSRLIHKDLMEVWTSYPNEITPLVLVLFTGFYMMYF